MASPLRRKTADAVAAALYDDVFTPVSIPSAVVTDQGGEFGGEVTQRLYDRLGITHCHGSVTTRH